MGFAAISRSVYQLMLFDQRLPGKRRGAHGHVKMVHRAGAIDDPDLRIGKACTDEIG
jgi:hypothetical protein